MYVKRCLLLLVTISTFICIGAVLNFDDENYFGMEADRYNWNTHPCNRICNGDSKMCNYVFVIEQLSSMSKACYDCPFNMTDCFRPHCMPTDGSQKLLYVVNRQLPGPKIQVCPNDVINVEVRNAMMSESTSIHWHGIDQAGTPYMDGVPHVTQCPILPGERFTYSFKVTHPGTYFWHSHIGSQRADGYFGPLIVRPLQSNNPHGRLYDVDDTSLIIHDWMTLGGDEAFIKTYHDTAVGVTPTTLLINGLGRFTRVQKGSSQAFTPLAVFNVNQNFRHRFRLINAGAENCPIIMSIDKHPMRIISLDSNDIEATEVDAITTWPGERVDFIVTANQKVDNYWIRLHGLGLCQTNATSGAFQVAILRYSGAANRDPQGRIGYNVPGFNTNTRILNPYDRGTESGRANVSIPNLTALAEDDQALKRKADHQVFMTFDVYSVDNYNYHRTNLYGIRQVPANRRIGSLQINHITMKMPSFPLLSQWNMIKSDTLCNTSIVDQQQCKTQFCGCTYVEKVRLNSVVELIFVDQGISVPINHPLHLHGHFFRVVATENLEGNVTINRVKQLDREGKIKRRLTHAPIKDTMKAPSGGYTIVRFYANNPGYWLFHCHFEQHINDGMAMIFKVGEHKDFPAVPKNFPVCGTSPSPFTRKRNA